MGRPKKELTEEQILSLLDDIEAGIPQSDIADKLEISIPTLARRIGDIQKKEGILMQYRAIQSLQLTSLQARILEAITPTKIEEAGLKDLVLAFKILKEKEIDIETPEGDAKGLLAYLIELEKRELALKKKVDEIEGSTIDVTPSESELLGLPEMIE